MIYCTRRLNFLSLVQPNIHYCVHSGLLLVSALLSMCTGHILTSHNFKIHINAIVPFTHISCKWCLGSSYSGYKFVSLFLMVMHATFLTHLALDKTSCEFRHSCHWLMFSCTFQRKMLAISSTGRIVFDVCTFQNETLTVCRNVCNQLTCNVTFIAEERLCYLYRCKNLQTRVTACILVLFE